MSLIVFCLQSLTLHQFILLYREILKKNIEREIIFQYLNSHNHTIYVSVVPYVYPNSGDGHRVCVGASWSHDDPVCGTGETRQHNIVISLSEKRSFLLLFTLFDFVQILMLHDQHMVLVFLETISRAQCRTWKPDHPENCHLNG